MRESILVSWRGKARLLGRSLYWPRGDEKVPEVRPPRAGPRGTHV